MSEPNLNTAAFKAGLFILAMIVLAVVMVLAIAGAGRFLTSYHTYTVVFLPGENVAALKPDGQVRLLGVPVGSIGDVRAIPDDEHGVTVQVDVQIPTEFTVREGAKVVVSASLTGDTWIDFDSLGDGERVTPGSQLDGRPGGIAGALAEVATIVPEARAALAKIDAAADSFNQLAQDSSALVERGRSVATHLDEVLGDGKTDLRTTLANLKDITGTAKTRLPETLSRLDQRLDETQDLMATAQEAFDKVPAILDEIEPAAADAKALVAQVRTTLSDNRAKIDRTVASVTRTADDLKGAVSEIRAAPWRLLYKPDERDQRNLALYAAARQYAFGAQDLETAARSLEDAINRETPDADQIAAYRSELESSFENFVKVQDDLWSQLER